MRTGSIHEMNDDRDVQECRECGAMVDRMGKHRLWQEALNRLVPGLPAVRARREQARRAAPPPNVW